MPLTCIPHAYGDAASLKGNDADGERSYTVVGTEDPTAAIAKASTVAPSAITVSTGVAWLTNWSTELLADNTVKVTAKYEAEDAGQNDGDRNERGKPAPAVGEWEFRGSYVSRSLKLQFARGTAKRAGTGGLSTYNTFSNAIGWDGKKINGVEWPSGNSAILIRSYFRAHTLTVDLLDTYNAYIGYINNNDNWLGRYAAGEARFLGSNLDQVIPYAGGWPSKPVAVDFAFDISKNGDVTVPGLYWDDSGTDTTSKKGWQYLDVYSELRFDANGIPIPVPKIANIRDIGPETNFATAFAWNPANRRGAGIPPPP